MAGPIHPGDLERDGADNLKTLAVVDRLVDGRYAVLLVGEEETERVVDLACLPTDWRELLQAGRWLRVRFDDGRLAALAAAPDETATRTQRISAKLEQLRRRGRQADRP